MNKVTLKLTEVYSNRNLGSKEMSDMRHFQRVNGLIWSLASNLTVFVSINIGMWGTP